MEIVFCRLPVDRIVVKPNGIPDPGAPAPLGDGFLYMARLSPEKGLGLLLDAWRRHPDGSLGPLRIAGDGELRPLAEAAAAERADVTYLGPLDRAGVRAAIEVSAVIIAAFQRAAQHTFRGGEALLLASNVTPA